MARDPLLQYAELARRHAEPNDGTRTWVQRVNRAADAMREIAMSQLTGAASDPDRFASLLGAEEECTRLWAAHHLLEFGPTIEPSLVARALAIIERNAAGDSVEALGNRAWLSDWYGRNPQ